MMQMGVKEVVWTLLLLLLGKNHFVLSLIPQIQDEVLINEDTQECTLKQVRECAACFLRSGWKSIGFQSRGATCPSGYTQVDSSSESSFCVASRSNFCCSSVVSGTGDCEYLAFSEDDEKCTITLCNDLPNGWSRNAPSESFDGLCPYPDIGSSWIESEDLGCDDPCLEKTSCGECIDTDCKWSFADNICRAACDNASTCLGMPIDDMGISTTDLCAEMQGVVSDNIECEAKSNCKDCSDADSGCRWVDTCGDQDGIVCGQCFATSCGGTCNEIWDCSAIVPTATSTEKVTTTTAKVSSSNTCEMNSGKCVNGNGRKGCCVKGSCRTHSFWLLLCRRPKRYTYGKKRRKKPLFGRPKKYGKGKGFVGHRTLDEAEEELHRSLRH